MATCRPVDEPPNLDGKLDEPFWNKADRLRLRGEANQSKTPSGDEVQLAYDAQFLYIAIHCHKATNIDYAPDNTPRPHDADLTQHDRVTLRLDVDRDYTTAFELTVDNRGWTHDACCGDATWDPTWYVAAASDENWWTIEAAIPRQRISRSPTRCPRHLGPSHPSHDSPHRPPILVRRKSFRRLPQPIRPPHLQLAACGLGASSDEG